MTDMCLHRSSSAPSPAVVGQIYQDSDDGKVYICTANLIGKTPINCGLMNLWPAKTRVETSQAERLMEMYNELIDVFVGKLATISEVMTVLRMAELNAVHGYLNKQLNPDSIAQAALLYG